LWRTDGTAAGTASVQVIDPFDYAGGNGQANATAFTKVGRRVIFFADDGVHGMEPWTGWASVLENRPAQAIADLRGEVNDLSLPASASSPLLASLSTAARALRGGNAYAIPWLETFVQQVNAETPQWIAPEAGAELVDFAQGIIGLLRPHPTPPVE
jgi:ELWxxDGT repeat protein